MSVGRKIRNIGKEWERLRKSSRFHNFLMFLIFMAIAAVFWFILALNDNVTETFNVTLKISNVPDSVTFITEPPREFHVTLRDKGTNILRSGVVKDPTINIDFKEYARDGLFRVSQSDFLSELKTGFGGAAQISSLSLDSIRCYYVVGPGKRVPVIVNADLSPASGYIIEGKPVPVQKTVLVYSYGYESDTIQKVYTQRLIKKDLSQSSVFATKLVSIPGVKIIPAVVDVSVNVQPLVSKDIYVDIDILNMPEGENLLLFPNKVQVSFFVPMSRFNDENYDIHVVVDYNDIKKSNTPMIPVSIASSAPNLVKVVLKTDSVEYSIIKK